MSVNVNERAALAGIDPRARGRPPKQPPADAARQIEDLAADGWSIVGIAWKLGATKKVFYRWMEENESLSEAFQAGRERERHTLHNRLYRAAMEEEGKGSVIAAMFLLKARHGYREGDQGEQANRISVTINMPGALSRDDYLKTVTNDDTELHALSAPIA